MRKRVLVRAVVQRVSQASVTVGGEVVAAIDKGLCVLVAATHGDTEANATKMAEKLWHLRIFEDEQSRMNLSASDISAELLIVSQFTLYGDTTRGRRPSFVDAAVPGVAEPLINKVCDCLKTFGAEVSTGKFGAAMKVDLCNDGPITIILDV